MCCAPWLLPFRIHCETLRNLVELLGYELKLERLSVNALHIAVFLADRLLELLPEILPDDVYDLAEACLHSIVNGIVNDCFTIRTETVHLFQSAVAAAHSGSKYK